MYTVQCKIDTRIQYTSMVATSIQYTVDTRIQYLAQNKVYARIQYNVHCTLYCILAYTTVNTSIQYRVQQIQEYST